MQVVLHFFFGGGRGRVGMQGTLALHLEGGEGRCKRKLWKAQIQYDPSKINLIKIFTSFLSILIQVIFYPIRFQIKKGKHFNLLFFAGQQLQKYSLPPAGSSWVEPKFNNSNRLAGGQPASHQIHLALAFGGGRGGKGLECKVHWPCIWGGGGGGNPNASELAFFF